MLPVFESASSSVFCICAAPRRSLPGPSVHATLGKNTGMSCHFLLQGVFLTQELNLGLLHCRQVLLHCLSHQRSCYCIYSYAISLVLFFLFGILSSLLFIWFPLLNIKTKPCSLILVIVANPNYANVLNSVCICVCVCVCIIRH